MRAANATNASNKLEQIELPILSAANTYNDDESAFQ